MSQFWSLCFKSVNYWYRNFIESLENVILVLQTNTIIIFGISSFNGGK